MVNQLNKCNKRLPIVQLSYVSPSLPIEVMRMTSLVTFTSAPAILDGKRRDGEDTVW